MIGAKKTNKQLIIKKKFPLASVSVFQAAYRSDSSLPAG
jgi:hypothetical protein